MRLFTKKTEANLAHVKWASTRMRMLSAFGNFRIDKSRLTKFNEEPLGGSKKLNKSDEKKVEKRISLEELTSNSYGQNSDFENILSLLKLAFGALIFLAAYVPYKIIKYFIWDFWFRK